MLSLVATLPPLMPTGKAAEMHGALMHRNPDRHIYNAPSTPPRPPWVLSLISVSLRLLDVFPSLPRVESLPKTVG